MRSGAIVGISLLLGLGACDLPKDPEGTLESARKGEIRVGVLPGNTEAAALDRQIVAILGEASGATAAFRVDDAHALFHALGEGEIDLVIGGVPASSPFHQHAGMSREVGPLFHPGSDERRVLAIRSGENAFLIAVNRAIHEHHRRGGT